MFSSYPNFKRIMLILSPCAALSSFDMQGKSNMNGTPADYEDLKNNKKTAVVMIASDSCGHCKAASPHFEEISHQPDLEHIEFIKLKSSENPTIMEEHKLEGVPAFIFIKDGEVQRKELGFESKEALHNMIKEHATQDDARIHEAKMSEHFANQVDAHAPVQEVPAHEEGVVAKIYGFFAGLFNAIKHMFVRIFDWIKGLFSR